MNSESSTIWLKKAIDDLEWTKANIREKIYYGACFTAQQSAEKALKAYLLSKEIILPKIHDLGAIVEKCIELDNSFSEIRESVLPLVDYYVQARYPDIGELIGYSEEKAKDALSRAQQVLDFVKSKT